jgi:DNA-binding transcriptional MerR regulator
MAMESIEANGSNGHSESIIPEKSFFRIGEASRLTSTKPFVLRYWETEFPMLQPVKSPKGHRLYRREDIEIVFTIKRLLYEEGFTIAGARRHLRDQAIGSSGSLGAVAVQEALDANAPDGANGGAEMPQAAGQNGEAAYRPAAGQLAMLNRQTLLDLRDSLRSLLTVLESE